MALKNLGFLGFFKKPKNLKSPNLGFLGLKKIKKPYHGQPRCNLKTTDVRIPGLFDMALKNLGFLGFLKKPKNPKIPNLGFLGLKKIKT